MPHIFVYGSLLFPELLTALTGNSFIYSPAILYGFKRFRVKGCDFPAIIEETRSKTEGLLIENVDEKSMEILSFFEGDEYREEKVTIFISDKEITAITFIWGADKSLLVNRDWDANEFKNKSLDYYLDKVVPETLVAFRSQHS
ncbi:MAG TPA: gamma-glutamylcyclotransferase family protein [Draconibacterium sp.]|nr:gamma-glutamylcyclotransferase family protein [Draconibacterium sp.]